MTRPWLTAALLVGCACLVFAAQNSGQRAPRPKTQNAKTAVRAGLEGEARFRTHCGRCHHPPEDISPRTARAVLRQMRVRARLTAEDEKLILEYLAP